MRYDPEDEVIIVQEIQKENKETIEVTKKKVAESSITKIDSVKAKKKRRGKEIIKGDLNKSQILQDIQLINKHATLNNIHEIVSLK